MAAGRATRRLGALLSQAGGTKAAPAGLPQALLAPLAALQAIPRLPAPFNSSAAHDLPPPEAAAQRAGAAGSAAAATVSGARAVGGGSNPGNPGAGERQQQQQQGPGSASSQQQQQSTVHAGEAAKFAALAREWWDPRGPFAPLHAMNPVRCRFLRSALCSTFGREAASAAPLAGLRLLDVGCGGGLLAESLARMGAHVTGIDVNEGGIATAEAHAALDPELAGRLRYRAAAAEQLVAEGASFDAVVASEVIEHVASLPAFCAALAALTRPGGAVAISTLNRTPRSYALAVLAAEYVLRWVPVGTHDWERFVTPEELVMQMEESTAGEGAGGPLRLALLAGMELNPLTRSWSLGRDTAVNYIALFTKPAAGEGREGGSAGAGQAAAS